MIAAYKTFLTCTTHSRSHGTWCVQRVSNWCIHSLKHYFSAKKWDRNKFLLCIIHKHSNTFIVRVFKQTWRWNYHSMNVSGYWCFIGKWTLLLKIYGVGGLNLHHPSVTITRIRDNFEVDGTVQDVLKGRCGVTASISPLNPSRLYLWGTLKNTVYGTKPQTLEELTDQIEHAINDIPLATIETVCCSVQRRCRDCAVAEGGHFEHVRA